MFCRRLHHRVYQVTLPKHAYVLDCSLNSWMRLKLDENSFGFSVSCSLGLEQFCLAVNQSQKSLYLAFLILYLRFSFLTNLGMCFRYYLSLYHYDASCLSHVANQNEREKTSLYCIQLTGLAFRLSDQLGKVSYRLIVTWSIASLVLVNFGLDKENCILIF